MTDKYGISDEAAREGHDLFENVENQGQRRGQGGGENLAGATGTGEYPHERKGEYPHETQAQQGLGRTGVAQRETAGLGQTGQRDPTSGVGQTGYRDTTGVGQTGQRDTTTSGLGGQTGYRDTTTGVGQTGGQRDTSGLGQTGQRDKLGGVGHTGGAQHTTSSQPLHQGHDARDTLGGTGQTSGAPSGGATGQHSGGSGQKESTMDKVKDALHMKK